MMQVNCTLEPCDTSGGARRRGYDVQASLDTSNFGTQWRRCEIDHQAYSACFDGLSAGNSRFMIFSGEEVESPFFDMGMVPIFTVPKSSAWMTQ